MFKRPTVRIVGRLEKKNWGLRPSKLHFPYAPGKSSPPPASLRSACCRAALPFAPLFIFAHRKAGRANHKLQGKPKTNIAEAERRRVGVASGSAAAPRSDAPTTTAKHAKSARSSTYRIL